MAEIIDVIKGIQQAVANSFDGSGRDDTGLRREEPTPITDKRIMDGFGCRVQGDILLVNYHAEMPFSNSKPHQLQDEVDQTLQDVISFLKKEYKRVTGETLSLSPLDKEASVHAEYLNRQRLSVKAVKRWTISGLGDYSKGLERDNEPASLDDVTKDFLQQGKPEFIQELV
jgi:hypothetical protein